jgi:hypothetical protein
MLAQPERRVPDSAVAKLAARSRRPRHVIEKLYLDELESLERGARIRTYLPLVALGRVREALRRDPIAPATAT